MAWEGQNREERCGGDASWQSISMKGGKYYKWVPARTLIVICNKICFFGFSNFSRGFAGTSITPSMTNPLSSFFKNKKSQPLDSTPLSSL